MEIGNWKSVAGMTETYNKARELGLESNIAEYEAFGFTVIEPEKTGVPKDFAKRLLDTTLSVADKEDRAAVGLNKREDRPAYGRQLFHLLEKDPIYLDAMMNPVVQTMGKYMMGSSMRLLSMVAFVKDGPARSTHVHTDSVGVPSPLPAYGSVCNISWILTDYTKEKGSLCFVPGSHRFCRHPSDVDQPKFMGGTGDDDLYVPLIAKPGSLALFHGNMWHGSYPKTTNEMRAHVVVGFCRNYYNPPESYADLDESIVARGGPEFARQIGRMAWQGYGSSGPDLSKMMLVRSAYQTQYG
jgi:ectoine hydroxylase-related dioxygenase (phytanoyl-CoA dioxygenase family)